MLWQRSPTKIWCVLPLIQSDRGYVKPVPFWILAESIVRYIKSPKAGNVNAQIRRFQHMCKNVWMNFDANAVTPMDSAAFASEVIGATEQDFPSDALCRTITVQLEAAVKRTAQQERQDLYRRLEDDLALHSSYAHSRVKEGLPSVTCDGGVKEFLRTEACKWRTQWTSEHTVDFTLPCEFRPNVPRTARFQFNRGSEASGCMSAILL